MNGIEHGQAFDPAFDAYFQAPTAATAPQQDQRDPNGFSMLDTGNTSYGSDSLRGSPSALHLNISGLSVRSDADIAQQQQQQQFLNDSMLYGSAAMKSSPGTSPAELLPNDPSAYRGGMAASSPLKNEHGTGEATPLDSFTKSEAGSHTDSPSVVAHSGIGNQSIGDTSVDDASLTNLSEADLAAEKRQSSKFVYKLFRMVGDADYQHLISWNRNGTSVMVCNFDEFSKEVLGKHFKHSNFSSFIRQLNMYGFYKVNKTPRGHRQSVDAQIWEFSHPKFLRGRPDLLDDIRRKALDSEHARVEARDLQYSVSVGQMQLRQQVDEMQFRIEELTEQNMSLRNFTGQLRDVLGLLVEHIKRTNGGNMAFDIRLPTLDMPSPMPSQGLWTPQLHDGPPIFVTEPEFPAARLPNNNAVHHNGTPTSNNAFDPYGISSTPLSRRVSASSAYSDGAMVMNGSPMNGSPMTGSPLHGSMHSDHGMIPVMQRSASFGEGQMPPPQFPLGRGRPNMSGLAIDTSAAGSYNVGLGVLSMPPSPLTPQHQAMMSAINTPLPPSPVPGAHFNSTEGYNPGFPPFANAADQAFFGPEGQGPNAKSMRTPMRRTASNSGPSLQGTPVLNQQPGFSKRKSPM